MFSCDWLVDIVKAHVLDVHLPNILIGIGASVEVPLITTLGRRVGATTSEIAKLVMLSSLCRTLLDIPYGVVVEYLGVRFVMMSCLLLNFVAAVVGFFVFDIFSLGVYCMVSGVSLGGFFLSRHIFVAGITSKKFRGRLMSFLSGLLRWAHVIGPMVSGYVTTKTGDVQYSFILPMCTAALAVISLSFATYSTSYQEVCSHNCSCTNSRVVSDEDESYAIEPDTVASAVAVSAGGPPSESCISCSDDGIHQFSVDILKKPDEVKEEQRMDIERDESAVRFQDRNTSQKDECAHQHSVHPQLGSSEEHNFTLKDLWFCFYNNLGVIFKLGFFVVISTALRSNRKLMLAISAIDHNLNDAELSYLLSLSFAFDAILFPLGGIIMDKFGRRFAVIPASIGFAMVFAALPFCHSRFELAVAASAFGVVDSLGCGLLMTLTADFAPKVHSAPFFGIIRTIQDAGHVVGNGITSILLKRFGFGAACFFLVGQGVLCAVVGVLMIYGHDVDEDDTVNGHTRGHRCHAHQIYNTHSPNGSSSSVKNPPKGERRPSSRVPNETSPLLQTTSAGSAENRLKKSVHFEQSNPVLYGTSTVNK